MRLAYHWLDPLGNPIVWDGTRAALPRPVAPGETVELDVTLAAPRPPGGYLLSFDLVEEYRFWFARGRLDDARPPGRGRPADRRAPARRSSSTADADAETTAALAAQEEPLVERRRGRASRTSSPARLPAPDWSRRLLDAHAEGWAAVGGAVDAALTPRRRTLAPWAPAAVATRGSSSPLLFPSLLDGLEPGELARAYRPTTADGELFDGRAVVRLRPRSGRPRA